MSFRHIRKYIAINDYSTISITHLKVQMKQSIMSRTCRLHMIHFILSITVH